MLLGITLFTVSGCSAPPDKTEVEETIVKYFEVKGNKVVELNIGSIKSIEISEKTYMGTPGYMVDIPLITLQPVENVGDVWNYKEGEKTTFQNARIMIQQSTGPDKRWIISYISGISAQ
ncbi:MAG: hypothetical protein C4538_02185 [Nitrospiraceae bacterium]|nr:MAG: hypothetical protein C4538_02185 [Nitrospiraceae bacterium]